MPDYRLFNLSNSTEIPRFVGSAVPELAAASQAMQQRYDTALQYEDMLDQSVKTAASTPYDAQMLDELKNKYRGRMKEFAQRGDYENLVRETRRAARDFANEYKPIAENVQRVQQYREKIQQDVDKGVISKDTADKALDFSMRSYKGLQRDPKTGQLTNQFTGFNVGPDLKLNEWVDKQLVGMKDWKTGQTIQKIDNSGQYYVKNGDKWELLTWDRIKPVLDAAKKTDPFFQSWARQQAVLNSYQAEHVPEDALMQSGLYKQIWDEKQRTGLPAKEVYRQMLQDSTLRNIDSAIEQFGKKHEVRNHEWERSVVKETEEFGRRAAAEEKKKSNFGFGLAYAANDPGLQVKDTYNFNEIMSNAGTTAQKVRGDWESWLNAKGTDGKPLRKIEGEKFLERTPGGKWTDVTSEGNTRKNAFISQLKEVENLKAVQKAALEEAGFNEAEIRSITNKSTQTLMDKYKRYENPVGGRQMMGDNTRMPAMMKDESTLLKTSDERFKRYEKILTNRLNGGQSPNELLEIRDADAKKTIKDLVSLSAGKGVGLEKGMIPISIGSGKDQGKQLDEDDYEDIASTLEPVGFINDVATGKTKLIMRTTKEVKGKKTAGEDLILETTALTGIDEHLQQNMTARDYTKFAMDRAVKTSLAQTQSGMTTLNLGSADKPVNISIQRTYDNKTPVFKVVIPTADGQTITEKVQSYDAVADLLTLLKTGQQ